MVYFHTIGMEPNETSSTSAPLEWGRVPRILIKESFWKQY